MGDGLLSTWAHAELDGEPLSLDHIFNEVGLFVAGGAAGDRLALVYPSANRDETVFDDPFTFDVRRDPNPHLAFGHGTHFCIGSNFARKELELLFAKLTRTWTDLRVIDEVDVEANIFAPAVRTFGLGFSPR